MGFKYLKFLNMTINFYRKLIVVNKRYKNTEALKGYFNMYHG